MIDINPVIDGFSTNWDKVTTVALAGWGALLSTIIFLKDRPNIEVGINRGFAVGLSRDINTLSLTVSNSGRRPVVIQNVNFATGGGQNIFLFPNQYLQYELPKKLKENEQITLVVDYDFLKSVCFEKAVDINYLVFSDSLGNKYKTRLRWKYWSDLKWGKMSVFRKNLANMILAKEERIK